MNQIKGTKCWFTILQYVKSQRRSLNIRVRHKILIKVLNKKLKQIVEVFEREVRNIFTDFNQLWMSTEFLSAFIPSLH